MRSHLKHFSYLPLNDFSRITTTCILALKRSKVRSPYLALISSMVKLVVAIIGNSYSNNIRS